MAQLLLQQRHDQSGAVGRRVLDRQVDGLQQQPPHQRRDADHLAAARQLGRGRGLEIDAAGGPERKRRGLLASGVP